MQHPTRNSSPERPEIGLVSCLCVTEDRAAFLPWLLWNYEKQDHPARELVVVDSSSRPPALDERAVTLVRCPPGTSIAAKRNLAVEAAKAAFPSWSKTPPEERFELLNNLAGLIERDLEALAEAESVDNGKPVSLARSLDIPRSVANFKFYATGAMHTWNELHETVGKAINYTLRQPLGVVGCISPWNLPLYLFTWKIAPALAAPA